MQNASSTPITLAGLQSISAKWLFPALVVNMSIGNQLWRWGPFLVGQMISWINDLIAVVIVVGIFRRNLWPMILVMCIFSAKGLALLTTSSGAKVAYLIFLNSLFCAAGAVIACRRPNLIYKQVMIICLLNTLLMVMQVANIGQWTQFLATEGDKVMYPSLFVQDETIPFSIVQGRPSGFLSSNNILSLIILFGLVLHFSRSKDRYRWGTFMLCAMIVISMARVVFLGFILLGVFLLFLGNRHQKLEILKAFVLTIILFRTYILLFPALFTIFSSLTAIYFSILLRVADIFETLPKGSFIRAAMEQYLGDMIQPYISSLGESHVSGWAFLIPVLPYLVILFFILTPFFIWGLRKQHLRFPHLTQITVLSLLMLAVYLFAVPFHDNQIYWFIGGFAFFPLFVLLQPRYFKGSLL